MIKKTIILFCTYLLITSNVFGAGSGGGDGGETKVKKLTSYDSAVNRIKKAKKLKKRVKIKKPKNIIMKLLNIFIRQIKKIHLIQTH